MASGFLRRFVGVVAVAMALGATSRADEGMWLFDGLPTAHLKQHHGFSPSDQWARHIMLSSVRFNSGGSASFVSSTGLVLTNHHVGSDTIQKLSTSENDYYADGFLARSTDQELKAPDLELNQLVSIEDVTKRVSEAVKEGLSPADAFAARRAVISEIEKESLGKTGLRSDVVTLYGGARYHLYQYKKYTDVRLVWAPHAGIALFGGDADNFEYPRYCLDACLFRVYEDDKPAIVEHFLEMSPAGAAEGELVFVSGNPGRTQRIFTMDALRFQRDSYVPYVLNFLRRREVLFQQYGFEGEEQERLAKDELLSIQNSRKAFTGMLKGLQDPSFLALKQADESSLRAKVQERPQTAKAVGAWRTIEEVQARKAKLLGQTAGLSGRLFEIATTLVFMAAEDQKPNSERLREYAESGRESLNQRLFSEAPIYKDLEFVKLADSLALLVERRGGDHPLVQQVLAGQSPSALAAALVAESTLADVETRQRLAKGGKAAIDASTDPLIKLAILLEPEERRLRAINDEISEIERQAYSQIADAQFSIKGTDTYPDATFTLRLSFGTVRGYRDDGDDVPSWTTLGGAYLHEEKHGAKVPWVLPALWRERKTALDLDTPFNFVCTADIIGGNSGSPVVNKEGQLVGLIFDGNIQSLTGDYFYSDTVARAVAVHSSAVLESLRKVYDAQALADELGK